MGEHVGDVLSHPRHIKDYPFLLPMKDSLDMYRIIKVQSLV